MALAPGTHVGPYEVVGLLGAGGMGEVYRARDAKLRRDVALKVLPDACAADPDRLARFQREAEVLAAFTHPGIASIYGIEETAGAAAIVLELVEGDTLADRIARGPIPVDEALTIARQLADALEAAHDRGVIHRDLKPANIKVTPEGRAKVLDFGLAKMLEPDTPAGSLTMSPTISVAATRAGVILGTAAYMSPEQARGRVVDRRTDIWSFGCVVYEMLTGRRVFDAGDTVSDAVAAILKTDPDWNALPPDTPPHIRTLLRRCLQKDPQRRLPHIGLARLEIDEPPAEAGRASPAARTSRRMVPWIVTAAALAVAAVAVAAIWNRSDPPSIGMVRVSINPPEGMTIGHNTPQRGTGPPAPHFAPSPDGRLLAYVMFSTGKPQLWVRRMADLDGQALPGTDDAAFPFWSPDNRSVAFFAEGKLKAVDVAGGPPRVICDAAAGEGGSWNQSGDIIFAPNDASGLMRVAALGGSPSALTTLDDGQKERSHRWPQFLPDGRHFLYLALAGRISGGARPFNTADLRNVYVGSLDGPDRTLLLKGGLRAQFASGHLVFMRDDTLLAQPMTLDPIGLSGQPIPIAERVATNAGNGRTAFATNSGHVLVYRSLAPASGGNRLVEIDRSGREIRSIGREQDYAAVRLSRDGQQLAIEIAASITEGTSDLWILDLSRGVPSRFTFKPEELNVAPVWSPDGKTLVFGTRRKAANDLYEKSTVTTGDASLLLESAMSKRPSSWSSDGRYLAYSIFDGRQADIWILPLAGDRKPVPFMTSPSFESAGQFSPDGRWIAYESDAAGPTDVYVRPYVGSGKEIRVSGGGGFAAHWRADGKELFYQTRQGIVAVPVSSSPSLSVGKPELLFERRFPRVVGQWDVFPDGQHFIVTQSAVQTTDVSSLIVVLNWDAALASR